MESEQASLAYSGVHGARSRRYFSAPNNTCVRWHGVFTELPRRFYISLIAERRVTAHTLGMLNPRRAWRCHAEALDLFLRSRKPYSMHVGVTCNFDGRRVVLRGDAALV